MKSLKILMLATVIMFSVSVNAQTKIDTIKVSGECGMCKSRIQKTLKIRLLFLEYLGKVDGIASAVWDTETKFLVVAYDVSKISNDDIQKKIAAVGHDTEKYTADDKVYEKLPGCCQYERKKEEMKGEKQH